jgi:hypothetical protein
MFNFFIQVVGKHDTINWYYAIYIYIYIYIYFDVDGIITNPSDIDIIYQ